MERLLTHKIGYARYFVKFYECLIGIVSCDHFPLSLEWID